MTKYISTIRHHSISRAREIETIGTLPQAKRAASDEFGDEQTDYQIMIFEDRENAPLVPVASKRVGARCWSYYV